MAAGRPAFRADTPMATLDAVIHGPTPALQPLREDLPASYEHLVRRCLEKDRERRPASMDEVAAALTAMRRGESSLPPRPTPRRVLAPVLAVIFALIAAVWWFDQQPGDAPLDAEPPAVAVLAFRDLDSDRDDQHLGAMLARLVTAEMGASANLSLVSQQRLSDVARRSGLPAGPIASDHITDVARNAEVDIMLLGQVGRSGQQLMATLEVVDVESGRSLGSPAARVADADAVFELAEELGRAVRNLLAAPDLTAEERSALQRQLTSSVDAYRAFVRGQQALLANDVDAAVSAFRDATQEDPAFALAQFQLATALVWTGDDEGPRLAMERSLAFRDRLPKDAQRLLDAAIPYYFDNDTRTALPILEAVLADDPWQRDALYMTGEIATHSATRNDVTWATDVFERLLSVEPGFSLVYEHLVSADLRSGRPDQASERIARWRAAGAAGVDALDGLVALWTGHHAEAVRLRPDDHAAALLARASGVDAIVPSRDDRRLESLEGLYRCVELDLMAAEHVYAGAFDQATARYEEARSVAGVESRDGFLTSARAGARHRLAELHALRGDDRAARALVDAALAIQPDSFRCLYVAAVFAARAGDAAALEEHVLTLVRLADLGWSPTASLYRDAALAEQHLFAGEPEQARALLQPVIDSGRLMEDWYAHEDGMGTPMREALARACRALGDDAGEREALRALVDSGLERLRHPVTWVLSLRRLGELALQAGDEAAGRAWLQRFLAHWGDVELPEVQDARRWLEP